MPPALAPLLTEVSMRPATEISPVVVVTVSPNPDPVIVEPKLRAPVPVWLSVEVAAKVTGAPNVALPPWVVFVPLKEKELAVIVRVPGVAVGPIVTPPKEMTPLLAEKV